MKALKTVIFAATIMTGASAIAAEVSGNVALSSNYFFRGIDQSGGEALSGGFDVAFENGFYVGTWASSIDFSGGLELDYYAGYGGSISDEVSYDIGYLFYGYPQVQALKNLKRFTAAFRTLMQHWALPTRMITTPRQGQAPIFIWIMAWS